MNITERAILLKETNEALAPKVQELATRLAGTTKPLAEAAPVASREPTDSDLEQIIEVGLQSAETALDLVNRLLAALDL